MKIDNLLAEIRSVYLKTEIKKGMAIEDIIKCDPSHTIIQPILKNQFVFSNTNMEYGFEVLDGIVDIFGNLEITPVNKGDTIVLASDGYPFLDTSLEKCEEYLNELKKTDPLCIEKYKSVSGFTDGRTALDDRAFIKFIV